MFIRLLPNGQVWWSSHKREILFRNLLRWIRWISPRITNPISIPCMNYLMSWRFLAERPRIMTKCMFEQCFLRTSIKSTLEAKSTTFPIMPSRTCGIVSNVWWICTNFSIRWLSRRIALLKPSSYGRKSSSNIVKNGINSIVGTSKPLIRKWIISTCKPWRHSSNWWNAI